MGANEPTYVLDANVLIDYQGVDLSIFSLASKHLGRVLVSSQVVLDEVKGLSTANCRKHGIECIDPSMDHIALTQTFDNALSFHDLLCFALARDEQAICVTNDRRLRSHCTEHGLELRWGLQLMVELVDVGALNAKRAVRVATVICGQNPTLGAGILQRFCGEVE